MFKKVVVETSSDTIHISELSNNHIIVAKREGEHGREGGLIMKEEGGYILRLTNGTGSTGHHKTITDCVCADTK